MTTQKWPPISTGTSVETTQENPAVSDWSEEARMSRQWGVQGKIVAHHGGHGLSYEVEHPDGTIGHYDPTELEVLSPLSFNKNHPECGADEVFIMNADDSGYSVVGWRTRRAGRVAYSEDGEPLGNSWVGAFPVFVQKGEIREKDPKILERLEA